MIIGRSIGELWGFHSAKKYIIKSYVQGDEQGDLASLKDPSTNLEELLQQVMQEELARLGRQALRKKEKETLIYLHTRAYRFTQRLNLSQAQAPYALWEKSFVAQYPKHLQQHMGNVMKYFPYSTQKKALDAVEHYFTIQEDISNRELHYFDDPDYVINYQPSFTKKELQKLWTKLDIKAKTPEKFQRWQEDILQRVVQEKLRSIGEPTSSQEEALKISNLHGDASYLACALDMMEKWDDTEDELFGKAWQAKFVSQYPPDLKAKKRAAHKKMQKYGW